MYCSVAVDDDGYDLDDTDDDGYDLDDTDECIVV